VDRQKLARVYERWNGRLLVNNRRSRGIESSDWTTWLLADLIDSCHVDVVRCVSRLLAHYPASRDLLRIPFDLVLSGHARRPGPAIWLSCFRRTAALCSSWYAKATDVRSRGVGVDRADSVAVSA
jgi:hypothetical protein